MFEMGRIREAVTEQVTTLEDPLRPCPVSDLVEVVGGLQAEINRLGALQTMAIARVAATEDRRQEDGTLTKVSLPLGHQRMEAAALVSDELGVSEHTAARRVHEAARITSCMPAVLDAMAAGRLDGWRAGVVVDELTAAPAAVCRAVTDALWPSLGTQEPGPLRQRVRRVIGKLAPQVLRQRAEKARTDRGLTRSTDLFGADHWFARLPVDQARRAWAAIDALARRLRQDGLADTLEQARADAMTQLIEGNATAHFILNLTLPDPDGDGDESTGGVDGDGGTDGGAGGGDTHTDGAGDESTGGVDGGTDSGPLTPDDDDKGGEAGPHAPDGDHHPVDVQVSGADSGTARPDHDTGVAASPNPTTAAHDGRNAADPDADDAAAVVPSAGPCTTAYVPCSAADSTTPQPGSADVPAAFTRQQAPATTFGCPGTGMVEVFGFGIPGGTYLPADLVHALAEGELGTVARRVAVCSPTTGAILRIHDPTPDHLTPDDPDPEGPGRTSTKTRRQRRRPRATSSAAYRPPDALADLVRLRDGRCRFPGCHIAARFCDLDHVRPWPTGPTAAANLACLCRRHHRIKQRDGWRVRMHPDASLTWTDPTGRQRTTCPTDHLGATLPVSEATPPTSADAAGHESTPAPHPPEPNRPAPHPPDQRDKLDDDHGDEEPFSIWEDVLELWTRQYHAGLLDDDPTALTIRGDLDAALTPGRPPPGAQDEHDDPPPF